MRGRRSSPLDQRRAAHLVSAGTISILALALACEPDPCEDFVSDGATVEVGTGQLAFAPLADGAAVPYVRGIQGGTHVEGALRTSGLFAPADPFEHEAQLPTVSFTLHDDGGAMVGGYQELPRALTPTDDHLELVADPVIFFEDASALVGATLQLRARVTDVCGNRADDDGALVLTDPES